MNIVRFILIVYTGVVNIFLDFFIEQNLAIFLHRFYCAALYIYIYFTMSCRCVLNGEKAIEFCAFCIYNANTMTMMSSGSCTCKHADNCTWKQMVAKYLVQRHTYLSTQLNEKKKDE